MALGNKQIAIRGYDDTGRLRQSIWRISGDSRFADREEHLPVGTELNDRVSLSLFSRRLRELAVVCRSLIDHPDAAVWIDVEPQLATVLAEFTGAETYQIVDSPQQIDS